MKLERLQIRPMTVRDIDDVMAIDEKITGKPHAAYYEAKVAAYLQRQPGACLVAELEGKVVGFILADIRGWEFAVELAGWLEIIAIDPEYQGSGIGKRLIQHLFDYFKRQGVRVVYTMVNWNDGELIDYLRAAGFTRGDYINLVKHLDD